MSKPDLLIVGGGVIGLALAYELSNSGMRVQLIDRGELGREASWAGAGILPPANAATALHPYDQLRAISLEGHRVWAERLREETGIDNGYRRCGGLYLASSAGEAAALRGLYNQFQSEQIGVEKLTLQQLAELEPAIAPGAAADLVKAAYFTPVECQLRNPHYLHALVSVCQRRGVELLPNVAATGFQVQHDQLQGVETSAGVLSAGQYCFTSGAWTQTLLAKLGCATAVLPMRGQMLLYACRERPFARVLNVGNRYMVARDDGHVLVGSTEEEVGFDKRNTPVALEELQTFACQWVPELRSATLEQTWAGLRPATFDGFPYLGALPGLSNAFVAAGHFRSGLYLSPGTARVMSALLRGEDSPIDLHAFRVGRG
ncbi:MAG TPA: glycine oxidase ThiO [Pirellulaceae bacterium]|nr:glycine oxidase ThiO [Pirellulaceae bacterium]